MGFKYSAAFLYKMSMLPFATGLFEAKNKNTETQVFYD